MIEGASLQEVGAHGPSPAIYGTTNLRKKIKINIDRVAQINI